MKGFFFRLPAGLLVWLTSCSVTQQPPPLVDSLPDFSHQGPRSCPADKGCLPPTERKQSIRMPEGSPTAQPLFELSAGTGLRSHHLRGKDAASFRLDGRRLFFLRSPDYESQPRYRLVVDEIEAGRVRSTLHLEVNIENIKEAPVFQQTDAEVSIAKETPASQLLFDAQAVNEGASQPDQGIQYRLSGAVADFHLTPQTGQLTFLLPPERRTKRKYRFSLVAHSLTNGLSSTLPVTVKVQAVAFLSGCWAQVVEGSSPDLVLYRARLTPAQPARYTLGGVDAAAFSLDQGQLRLKRRARFSQKSGYLLTIGAQTAEETLSTEVKVEVVARAQPPQGRLRVYLNEEELGSQTINSDGVLYAQLTETALASSRAGGAVHFSWYRSRQPTLAQPPPAPVHTEARPPQERSSLVLQADDEGHYLHLLARYDDADQRAHLFSFSSTQPVTQPGPTGQVILFNSAEGLLRQSITFTTPLQGRSYRWRFLAEKSSRPLQLTEPTGAAVDSNQLLPDDDYSYLTRHPRLRVQFNTPGTFYLLLEVGRRHHASAPLRIRIPSMRVSAIDGVDSAAYSRARHRHESWRLVFHPSRLQAEAYRVSWRSKGAADTDYQPFSSLESPTVLFPTRGKQEFSVRLLSDHQDISLPPFTINIS